MTGQNDIHVARRVHRPRPGSTLTGVVICGRGKFNPSTPGGWCCCERWWQLRRPTTRIPSPIQPVVSPPIGQNPMVILPRLPRSCRASRVTERRYDAMVPLASRQVATGTLTSLLLRLETLVPANMPALSGKHRHGRGARPYLALDAEQIRVHLAMVEAPSRKLHSFSDNSKRNASPSLHSATDCAIHASTSSASQNTSRVAGGELR